MKYQRKKSAEGNSKVFGVRNGKAGVVHGDKESYGLKRLRDRNSSVL